VKIEEDPIHGQVITIEKLPELFIAIAFRLVSKPERLTGAEMRFLRKRMQMTQAELAKELWVSDQTVANYEKDHTDDGPADRALRYTFLAHLLDGEEIADELRLEVEDLMRPSRRGRPRPTGVGPWWAQGVGR
jgi:DNA-binding transcriptional regulator YiaG